MAPRSMSSMLLNSLRVMSSFRCIAGESVIAQSIAEQCEAEWGAGLAATFFARGAAGDATPSGSSRRSRTNSCSLSLISWKKCVRHREGSHGIFALAGITDALARGGADGCPTRRSSNLQHPMAILIDGINECGPDSNAQARLLDVIVAVASTSPSCSSSPAALSSKSGMRSSKPRSATSHKGSMHLDNDYQSNDIRLYLHDNFQRDEA
ncbi:hypothetical protein BDN70DRAFT_892242 [Pholiota conissans]|uniref:Uncharacterized protein n=1 Tax=Pholiota conissans TaxID=109636 RepID=A0A9P5ZA15_9AGAR|nr:hypothetical protein BDN70DRAFT_892242 [Pholiota conissans]